MGSSVRSTPTLIPVQPADVAVNNADTSVSSSPQNNVEAKQSPGKLAEEPTPHSRPESGQETENDGSVSPPASLTNQSLQLDSGVADEDIVESQSGKKGEDVEICSLLKDLRDALTTIAPPNQGRGNTAMMSPTRSDNSSTSAISPTNSRADSKTSLSSCDSKGKRVKEGELMSPTQSPLSKGSPSKSYPRTATCSPQSSLCSTASPAHIKIENECDEGEDGTKVYRLNKTFVKKRKASRYTPVDTATSHYNDTKEERRALIIENMLQNTFTKREEDYQKTCKERALHDKWNNITQHIRAQIAKQVSETVGVSKDSNNGHRSNSAKEERRKRQSASRTSLRSDSDKHCGNVKDAFV